MRYDLKLLRRFVLISPFVLLGCWRWGTDFGSLKISTEPEGAKVFVDAKLRESNTPLWLPKIKVGRHQIRVEYPEYLPKEETVIIVNGETFPLFVRLSPEFGELKIFTEPKGTKIFWNGILLEGKTPLYLRKIKSGEHHICIEHPNYLPKEETVAIVGGETSSIFIKLAPNLGVLYISELEGTNIVVISEDEKTPIAKGTTPAKIELPPGIYTVTLSKGDAYEPTTKQVFIQAGKETKLENIRLSPKFGTLEIFAEPSGANVLIDGKPMGETPLSLTKVIPGEYQVHIVYPNYLPGEKIVTVVNGSNTSCFIKLEPNFGVLHISSDIKGIKMAICSRDRKISIPQKTITEEVELPPGRYRITFSKEPLYEPITKHISIERGRVKEEKVKLRPIQLLREKSVRIPGGKFKLGNKIAVRSKEPVYLNERVVDLSEYWIGKHEVTVKEYAEFVYATGYKKPIGDGDYNWGKSGRENHPINCVLWSDAQAYVKWLSKKTGLNFRLPTEAEWEKAARGPNGKIYPWGNKWDKKRANFSDKNSKKVHRDNSVDDGYATTAPVGTYTTGKSYYGVYDMAGNVSEWCQDYYEKRKSKPRVARGGSWADYPNKLQASYRHKFLPNTRSATIGFRVVVSSEQ